MCYLQGTSVPFPCNRSLSQKQHPWKRRLGHRGPQFGDPALFAGEEDFTPGPNLNEIPALGDTLSKEFAEAENLKRPAWSHLPVSDPHFTTIIPKTSGAGHTMRHNEADDF